MIGADTHTACVTGLVTVFQRAFGKSLCRGILSGGEDRDDHDMLASGRMQRNQHEPRCVCFVGQNGRVCFCY